MLEGRPLQKPSIQRLGKRAAIFGPLLIVLVFITGGDSLSTGAKIFQAVLLLLVFIPLSYLLDHVMYRTLTRRHERKLGRPRRAGSIALGLRLVPPPPVYRLGWREPARQPASAWPHRDQCLRRQRRRAR